MPPAAVTEATDKYFKDENTIGRWLDERCRYTDATEDDARCEPNHWCGTRILHRDYAAWARRVGEFVLAERVFQQKLEQMPGIEPAQHPRTRRGGFYGIALRWESPELHPDPDDPSDAAATETADDFIHPRSVDGGVIHGSVVTPPILPNEVDDPAEDWPRE
jgi:phage/plasmid-associated DNA primase